MTRNYEESRETLPDYPPGLVLTSSSAYREKLRVEIITLGDGFFFTPRLGVFHARSYYGEALATLVGDGKITVQ